MSDQPRIIVVGSANMDLVVKAQRAPRRGETLSGGEFGMVPGGKGANQAVACARLGAETHFVGRIGAGAFGETLRQGYEREGLRIEHLTTDPDAPTGIAMIIVDADGDNSIVVAPGANQHCVPADLEALEPLLADAAALVLQLEIPLETVRAALEMGRAHGVTTILDAGPAKRLPTEVFELVDVISPNETEAEALLGADISDVESATAGARRFLQMGARAAVLKLGAWGAVVATPDDVSRVRAHEVETVDTTAAGDAFTAAMAVALAEGRSLNEAVEIAVCAGALAVTVFGAQPSLPTREKLAEFCQERGSTCL